MKLQKKRKKKKEKRKKKEKKPVRIYGKRNLGKLHIVTFFDFMWIGLPSPARRRG